MDIDVILIIGRCHKCFDPLKPVFKTKHLLSSETALKILCGSEKTFHHWEAAHYYPLFIPAFFYLLFYKLFCYFPKI